MGLSPKSNYEKKMFLVLTSGKFLEALGNGIGTGSIFCLSFSLSNRVSQLSMFNSCVYLLRGEKRTFCGCWSNKLLNWVTYSAHKTRPKSFWNRFRIQNFVFLSSLHSRRICLVWWAILPSKTASGEVGVWLPWWCPALVLPAPGNWGHFLNFIIFS